MQAFPMDQQNSAPPFRFFSPFATVKQKLIPTPSFTAGLPPISTAQPDDPGNWFAEEPFANWDNWPQMEMFDFSQFFEADMSQLGGW